MKSNFKNVKEFLLSLEMFMNYPVEKIANWYVRLVTVCLIIAWLNNEKQYLEFTLRNITKHWQQNKLKAITFLDFGYLRVISRKMHTYVLYNRNAYSWLIFSYPWTSLRSTNPHFSNVWFSSVALYIFAMTNGW